jgi:hypothetical protein
MPNINALKLNKWLFYGLVFLGCVGLILESYFFVINKIFYYSVIVVAILSVFLIKKYK